VSQSILSSVLDNDVSFNRTCIFCKSTHENFQALASHLLENHENDTELKIEITNRTCRCFSITHYMSNYFCPELSLTILSKNRLFPCISTVCDFYGTALMLHEHFRSHEDQVSLSYIILVDPNEIFFTDNFLQLACMSTKTPRIRSIAFRFVHRPRCTSHSTSFPLHYSPYTPCCCFSTNSELHESSQRQ
jgi:hypothetical protein